MEKYLFSAFNTYNFLHLHFIFTFIFIRWKRSGDFGLDEQWDAFMRHAGSPPNLLGNSDM
ncbi:MAG TPA: hypothetical protein EYN67_17645 [Flavobacteriales bacterium]|nr:hypothetical protein [Flavobacteriales bacterium]